MGLYGDKLTKSAGTQLDLLTKGTDTQVDQLSKSAGSSVDVLTKAAQSSKDDLIFAAPYNNIIKNSFDWSNAPGGIAEYWQTVIGGTGSIITGLGFTGNAQRVACAGDDAADLLQYLGGIIDGLPMRLKLKYYLDKDGGSGNLYVYQNPEAATITMLSANKVLTTVQIDFTAVRMNGLYFRMNSLALDYFIIDEVELYTLL